MLRLGFGIAKRLGQEGATLAVVDYDKNSLAKCLNLLKEEGISSIGIECDVGKYDQVSKAVREILQKYGKIDVLVQAAGITGKTK